MSYVCLPCARAMLRDRRAAPCDRCVAEAGRDRRAEAHEAVARYVREREDEMGLPDLVGLPTTGSHKRKFNAGVPQWAMQKAQQDRRRAEQAEYMRQYRDRKRCRSAGRAE